MNRALGNDEQRWKVYIGLSVLFTSLIALALALAAIARAHELDDYRGQVLVGSECLTPVANLGWSQLRVDVGGAELLFQLNYTLPPGEGGLQRLLLRGPRVALDGTILALPGVEAPIALTLCGGEQSCAALETISCPLAVPDCGYLQKRITRLDSVTPDSPLDSNPRKALRRLMELARAQPGNFYFVAESANHPNGVHCGRDLGRLAFL